MKIRYVTCAFGVAISLGLSACEDHALSPKASFPERINFVSERQYPEGIAYSAQLDRFLVSSIPQGKVGLVATNGSYTDFLATSDMISTMGMRVAGGRLFVCNSDQGTSPKSTPQTTRQIAQLLVYNIASRQLEFPVIKLENVYANLRHLANDLAVQPDGTVYVTDSFAPVIYKVLPTGQASVLVSDLRFSSATFGLNGIVYHSDGYLIVAVTSAGKLYKVDLKNGNAISEIIIGSALPGDGLTLLDGDLYVVTGGNRVAQVRSTDNWQTASIIKFDASGYLGATTSVAVNNQIYTLNARIGENGDARDFSIQRFR